MTTAIESKREVYDVLIIRRGDSLPRNLEENLLQKAFRSQTATDFDEALSLLKNLGQVLLLVDCGGDDDEIVHTVRDLVGVNELHSYPILVASKDADAYDAVLRRYFKLVAVIPTPCGSAEVLNSLEYLATEAAKLPRAPKQGMLDHDTIISPAETITEIRELDESELHPLYRELSEIPQIIFDAFERLQLTGRVVGGKSYVKTPSFEKLVAQGIIPPVREVEVAFENTCTVLGKWCRGHLQRVAWMAALIAHELRIPQDLTQSLKIAALLFPSALEARDRELVRREYLTQRQLMIRKDLCSKIKDTAMRLTVNFSNPNAGNILSLFGRYVGREAVAGDRPEELAANTLMATDLADRVCFRGGAWDPRAAFWLVQKLRAGKVREIHPLVLACLLKILSEAISASPKLLISKRQMLDPKIQELQRRYNEDALNTHERRIDISNLMPGMRLARPLLAYDGAELLASDLTLDQDLIWRIWQIAAIRPMCGPAVICMQ